MKRQPALKPQDLLVTLKIAANRWSRYTYAGLSGELHIAVSEVHAAVQRAEVSRLLTRSEGSITVVKRSLQEFVLHGARYSFPAILGPLSRGLATGISGPGLRSHFHSTGALGYVWPDPSGDTRGTTLIPLYQTVPYCSQRDPKLYELLSLFDALRIGAAREAEMAAQLLGSRLA